MRRHVPILLVGLAGCAREASPPSKPLSGGPRIHFTDVTAAAGIDMTITCGRTPSTSLPEAKGGGLALVDFDRDGDLDLFVPNGATLEAIDRGPGARLFENLGALRFRDVTREVGLDFHRWGMGVAVGDVDADGFDDLYVACFGRDALLRNEGGKRFVDVTEAAGLGDPRWSTAAAFGDLDGDGDLDLYVVNYVRFDAAHPPPPERFHDQDVFAGPVGKPCDADVLYQNDGRGRFTDVTAGSGIDAVRPSAGLGVVIFDFDDDGRQDVFVGNDSMPNFLFQNQGGMRFLDVGAKRGIAVNGDGQAQATMGIAIADVNGDGAPDVFTTNFANDTNTLHVSAKDAGYFTDRTSQYGLGQVSRPYLKWAAGFFDFDHDGDEDLLHVNGHVYPNATRETMDSTYLQPPLLFERRGERFSRVEAAAAGAWLSEPHADRSAVFGDLDGDGDVDVIVGGVNERPRVLRNDQSGGPWLQVELSDARPNVGNGHGLGARVVLRSGGRSAVRWNASGGGYLSNSAPYVHFGLPTSASVDLDVTWPDGQRETRSNVSVNQRLSIQRR